MGKPRRWSDEDLQRAVSESESIAQVIRKLDLAVAGASYRSVGHHIARLELDTSHFTGQAWVGTRPVMPGRRYSLDQIFCENSTYKTSHLLAIILREGYRQRECQRCGLTEWQGEPIPLEVEHVNGISTDHRLANLQLLCPNCHALTPTWRGRNKRKVTIQPGNG